LNKTNLVNVGFNERVLQEASIYPDLFVGRVASQYKDLYKIITEDGELMGEVSGKFRYQVKRLSDFPVVGDFVMIDRNTNSGGNAIIHHVLTRKSAFERKAAGTTSSVQTMAANIDTIFICMSLNNDFNLRRLERYISIGWSSGATPVVVLTKADLCEDLEAKIDEVTTVAMGVDILATTSLSEEGYIKLKDYIKPGKTVAFIGSSGVGKSTLVNRLYGESLLDTNGLRNDDKGKHTTTRRELIVLPEGGVVIDTPGLREIGIESADLSKSFNDIDDLAKLCKFHDCSHESEPGCAVQSAISDGILSMERLANYKKLKKEAKYDGLDSKQIEKQKINEMFGSFGGMKNAKNFIKNKNAKKYR